MLGHEFFDAVAQREAAGAQPAARDAQGVAEAEPGAEAEAEAVRLGAIVRDWIEASQLPLAPVVTEAEFAAEGEGEGEPLALVRESDAPPASPGVEKKGGRGGRKISEKMSELERQLAEL